MTHHFNEPLWQQVRKERMARMGLIERPTNEWLIPNQIVYWGESSERYLVHCVSMTGAGSAAWIQSLVSGFFVSIQPDEIDDLSPDPK